MKSLNTELNRVQAQLREVARLAAEYHNWDTVRHLSDAIEEVAIAKTHTTETHIASCDSFIQAARAGM